MQDSYIRPSCMITNILCFDIFHLLGFVVVVVKILNKTDNAAFDYLIMKSNRK